MKHPQRILDLEPIPVAVGCFCFAAFCAVASQMEINLHFIGLQEWALSMFSSKPAPRRRRTTCPTCFGTGQCPQCDGRGCAECNGAGRCLQCRGEGNILTGSGSEAANR